MWVDPHGPDMGAKAHRYNPAAWVELFVLRCTLPKTRWLCIRDYGAVGYLRVRWKITQP